MVEKFKNEKEAIYFNDKIDDKLIAFILYYKFYIRVDMLENDYKIEEVIRDKFIEYNNIIKKQGKKIDCKDFFIGFIDFLDIKKDNVFIYCLKKIYKEDIDKIINESSWLNELLLSSTEKMDLIIIFNDHLDEVYEKLMMLYKEDIVTIIIKNLIDQLKWRIPKIVNNKKFSENELKDKLIEESSYILSTQFSNIKNDKDLVTYEYQLFLSSLDSYEEKIYSLILPYVISGYNKDYYNILEIALRTNMDLLKCAIKTSTLKKKILRYDENNLKNNKVLKI